MRSSVKNFRLPSALDTPTTQRVEELPYDNFAEYVVGLIRYDLMTRREHSATAAIARMPRVRQDEIDEEIATIFAKKESIGGSWFEARLQAAVEASGKPEPERHKLVSELLKRIGGR